MLALVVTRKGDVQEIVVSSNEATLKAEGDRLDNTPLQWQSGWGGGWGAHSTYDEEKTFEIVSVRSIP
jgi:hypothetical protein